MVLKWHLGSFYFVLFISVVVLFAGQISQCECVVCLLQMQSIVGGLLILEDVPHLHTVELIRVQL